MATTKLRVLDEPGSMGFSHILPRVRKLEQVVSDFPREVGEVSLFIGHMWSGKTARLLEILYNNESAGRKCIAFTHSSDKIRCKGENILRCHPNPGCSLDYHHISYPALSFSSLENGAVDIASEHDVLVIDEGQWFDNLTEFCASAILFGTEVYVAGLDSDFTGEPFQNIARLSANCENLVKLNGICSKCKGKACYTQRTTEQTDLMLIGGSESYAPVCRKCFVKPSIQ